MAASRGSTPVGHLFRFRGGKVVHCIDLLNTAAFLAPYHGHAAGIAAYYTPASLTAAQYDEIIRGLVDAGMLPAPGGLIHACFGEPGQLRVLDVFDSMEHFQAFSKVLLPIVRKNGVEPGQPEIWPLHAWGHRTT